MSDSKDSFILQLRETLKDGVDYLKSVIMLLQAQVAHYAISTVVALILLFFAACFGVVALVLLNIALGFWLTDLVGKALWALLIMAGFYSLLVAVLGGLVLRWLKRLRS